MTSPLNARFGRIDAQSTLITASVLAAHGAAVEGFRLADVQYFFFLFGNWLERDLLGAGESVELTQVRRVLRRLADQGWVRAVTIKGRKAPRYALSNLGLEGLASRLVDVTNARSFDETVFVITFAACYRDVFVSHASKRLREHSRPEHILARARRRLERVLADLDERARSSDEVSLAARAARRAGGDDREVAIRLEEAGAYQLQHVRSFATFILSLPADLRAFELGPAVALRSDLLFVTFAEQARAQIAILGRLEQRLHRTR